MSSIERRVYGPDHFHAETRAARALLKFFAVHGLTHPALPNLQTCLEALEVGERSNAVAAFKRVPAGKEGFGEWWPPAMSAKEDEEYVWAVFEALRERWYRLMSLL